MVPLEETVVVEVVAEETAALSMAPKLLFAKVSRGVVQETIVDDTVVFIVKAPLAGSGKIQAINSPLKEKTINPLAIFSIFFIILYILNFIFYCWKSI
jgi:hypothetical protein